jgi:nucleotide-binding universal stress UspA family protein
MGAVRVIAGVDFSAISPAVVHSGVRLARRLGGTCLAVHTVEALRGDEESGHLLPGLHRWIEEVRREARTALDELLAETGGETMGDGAVEGEVLDGPACASLIRRTRQVGARCLVLGAPPPTRFLGATAARIVRKNPLATLVVRKPPQDGYRRVMIGVDFSTDAERAAGMALELAEPEAVVILCSVVNTWGLPVPDQVVVAEEQLRSRLAAWAAAHTPSRVVDLQVRSGLPKVALLDCAREQDADLLAVGSRGQSRLSHVLLGSIAEAAVRHAECDVLVAGDAREDFCLP